MAIETIPGQKGKESLRPSPIDDDTVKTLQKKASFVVVGNFATSKLCNEFLDDKFARFDFSELEIGRVLGQGKFCLVSEIKDFNVKTDGQNPTKKDSSTLQNQEYFTREQLAQYSNHDTDHTYAIKKLDEKCRLNSERFLQGTIELAMEAQLLKVLQHPNLIKLIAVASVTPYTNNYFLIFERIYDTLGTRITKWKETCYGYTFLISEKKKQAISYEKLRVVRDVSSAMQYLHHLDIIYRDLKPENIGFDANDNVKIFDLGSAKDLQGSGRVLSNMTYNLTGLIGCIPYMAPEVAKSLPYNLSADVYSFGMLFWHIIEMEPPFKFYRSKHYHEQVVMNGHRPVCNESWPKEWTNLMEQSWSQDPYARPTFTKINEIIFAEVDDLEEEVTVSSCQGICQNVNLGTYRSFSKK